MDLNLTVLNVKCGGCASNIQNGLAGMTGVETVDVDVNSGTVKISGDNLNPTEIGTKLSELGYPES